MNVQKSNQDILDTLTIVQDPGVINELVGNLYNRGWGAALHQLGLIKSELEELSDDGIAARNVHELRDGIADVLFTTLGLAHRAGIDAMADLQKVNASQYTKFDRTEEEGLKTREKYQRDGVEVVQEWRIALDGQNYLVTFSAKEQLDGRQRPIPAGKWLKSHAWQEPVFDALPTDVAETLAQ